MSLTAVMTPTAPPMVVGPTTRRATRPTNKLPQSLIDGAQLADKQSFDPKTHLNYQPPSKIYTMREIGLEGQGISPNAVTAPFQLFTEEAIRRMRAEIFSQSVLDNCQYTSDFVKNTIRGMGPARAPFICDAWKSPEVLSRISEVAGIDLVPAMDYEIAAINISINNQTVASTSTTNDDALPAFAWHRDSYPFVCVTMLSDCTGMTGGETALKTASGEIMKVRGPAMGTAVVMQGRYIEHQALKAVGGRERITMITSFRAKSPHVRDETVLTGVRPISNLCELYTQYTRYRLEVLEERVRALLKQERDREIAQRPFDAAGVKSFLTEQKQFLESMIEEIIE
ncbi:hypothetical protein ASPACDRAFT_44840 [Aspergillus aculeatus ATCC 16872]|uniref:Fe2OG dioxygenase domain-containing protein n=1 Tax=Aspergillus aculeatus (strain ATCC 16872 / CBS 172.66 / WB 5094) TaxID=690307 RepID=A0A1L9WQ65_ASPA1|nr:uncharacterized protein ASPACDRAFT_44840 [Aspergillus aculeatus ATCC 16872]OJJ98335.1 hypothetical protein ASPACDRAFT_44840 [Aspergillus aculeatus ATCC 16872]